MARPLPLAIQKRAATTIRLYVMGQGRRRKGKETAPRLTARLPKEFCVVTPGNARWDDPELHAVRRGRLPRGLSEAAGGKERRLHAHGAPAAALRALGRTLGLRNRTLQRKPMRALTTAVLKHTHAILLQASSAVELFLPERRNPAWM